MLWINLTSLNEPLLFLSFNFFFRIIWSFKLVIKSFSLHKSHYCLSLKISYTLVEHVFKAVWFTNENINSCSKLKNTLHCFWYHIKIVFYIFLKMSVKMICSWIQTSNSSCFHNSGLISRIKLDKVFPFIILQETTKSFRNQIKLSWSMLGL